VVHHVVLPTEGWLIDVVDLWQYQQTVSTDAITTECFVQELDIKVLSCSFPISPCTKNTSSAAPFTKNLEINLVKNSNLGNIGLTKILKEENVFYKKNLKKT